MSLVKVSTLDKMPAGTVKAVEVGGRMIALFNVDGKIHATDNTCPHAGGPLGEGDLEGHVVTCPWHHWQYDVTTGACPDNSGVRIKCYKVQIEGNDIKVEM